MRSNGVGSGGSSGHGQQADAATPPAAEGCQGRAEGARRSRVQVVSATVRDAVGVSQACAWGKGVDDVAWAVTSPQGLRENRALHK